MVIVVAVHMWHFNVQTPTVVNIFRLHDHITVKHSMVGLSLISALPHWNTFILWATRHRQDKRGTNALCVWLFSHKRRYLGYFKEHTSQFIWTFEPNIHTQICKPQYDEDAKALGCTNALWQQLMVFHNTKQSIAQQSRASSAPGPIRAMFVSHVTYWPPN